MTRQTINTTAAFYASAFFAVGLVVLGPSGAFVAFVILTTFVGFACYCAALSHVAAVESKNQRRKDRQERLAKVTTRKPSQPFSARLERFVDDNSTGVNERSTSSTMPLRVSVDLQRCEPTPPKPSSFIRHVLLRIRRLVQGTSSVQ